METNPAYAMRIQETPKRPRASAAQQSEAIDRGRGWDRVTTAAQVVGWRVRGSMLPGAGLSRRGSGLEDEKRRRVRQDRETRRFGSGWSWLQNKGEAWRLI